MEVREQVVGKKATRIAFGWFGSHILGCIVCALINFSLGLLIENWIFALVIGLISLFFYSIILGSGAVHLGQQDRNLVRFGHKEVDMWRGFKIGLLTSVPLFGFGIALILANAELLPNFYVIYKICNCYVLPIINLIDLTTFGVASAYLTMVSWPSIIGVVLLNFIPSIVLGVYYVLGYKDISISDKIVYKKKK